MFLRCKLFVPFVLPVLFVLFSVSAEEMPTRAEQTQQARRLIETTPDADALERALKLTEQVQLGGLDFWFGEAVVIWVRIKLMQDERDEVQSVLEAQLELLCSLEENLLAQGLPVSSISPLAGARFFLGDCYERSGTDELREKALHQFYNVYAKYGDSPWGPEASARAEKLIDYFEGQGRTVIIKLGANRQRMAQSAFRIARRLFTDKQYDRAVEACLDALNRHPETDDAVRALRELAQCYIYLENERFARATAEYLAERFSAESAAGVFYRLAGLRRQVGDAEGESLFLERILADCSEGPYGTRALGRLAWNAFERRMYANAAKHFAVYLERETDREKRTRACYALGEAYRHAEMRAAAIKTYDRFVATFPDSDVVEAARFAKGSVLMESERYEEALTAFAGFDGNSARKFLEPVLYYRGEAFFKTGCNADAIQSLESLLNRWPESGFFFDAKLVQGRAYAAAGNETEAVRVLGDVLKFAPNDLLVHRASFELGRAQSDPGERLASFQRVALLADPADPEQAELIKQSLCESLPLYFQLERYAEVVSDSRRYRQLFPGSENDEIAGWHRQAEAQLARLETEESES